MGKALPYFRWYPADAEIDENYAALDDTELGFFHRCLNRAWMNDGLPSDLDRLASTMRVTRKYLDRVWPAVSKCFTLTETVTPRYVNARQEKEREAALTKSRQSSDAVSIREQRRKASGDGADHPGTRADRLRAAKAKATHTTEEWQLLLELCDHKCLRCGSSDIQKDHIVAISAGGSDSIENIQPLCGSCNAAKIDAADYRSPEVKQAIIGRSSNDDPRAYVSGCSSDSSKKKEAVLEFPTLTDFPKTEAAIRRRFHSADMKIVIRITEAATRAYLDEDKPQIPPPADAEIAEAVAEAVKAAPGKGVGLLLTTVPNVIRSWAKYGRHPPDEQAQPQRPLKLYVKPTAPANSDERPSAS